MYVVKSAADCEPNISFNFSTVVKIAVKHQDLPVFFQIVCYDFIKAPLGVFDVTQGSVISHNVV